MRAHYDFSKMKGQKNPYIKHRTQAGGNSLVPMLSAGHRDLSLNYYTGPLGPLPYLR